MKKKFLSLAIVFMLTIAGVVGSLCLNNTMATYGATTTKTYKMKSDLGSLVNINAVGVNHLEVPFEIKAGNTTISGKVYEANDSVIAFLSEDESKCVIYSGHSVYGTTGWYVGVKTNTNSASTTITSSIKLLASVPSPTTYYDHSSYTHTSLSEAPTITLTDDETSTFSKFLQTNSEPNQLPSTGIMFDNKNYTMPLIILGSMFALTGVAMFVTVKSKKHN